MKIVVVSPSHKKRILDFIDKMSYDKRWVVECKLQKSNRSLQANALYWKWLTVIKQHCQETLGEDFSEDNLHDYYRKKFLPVTVKQMGQEEITSLTSTTKLNVTEMSDYMQKIDQFCADRLHLLLPTPDAPEE